MDYQQFVPITMSLVKATLAAGTTSTLSNTGTVNYAIRGKAFTRAALANSATPTTDAATTLAFVPVPANFGSVYIVGFNAATTLLCCQGQVVPLNSTGAFIQAPNFGGAPLDFCPIGYVIIKAGSTASSAPGWRFGTDNMSAVTGITYTFGDLISWTDRPFIA